MVSGEDESANAVKPSTASGKLTSVAVIVSLVMAGLLVSGKLVEIAERQPLGDSRNRWVDAAENVDRVANFLSLNRPYEFIMDLREVGDDAGEQVDTIEAVVTDFAGVAAEEADAVFGPGADGPTAGPVQELAAADPFTFRVGHTGQAAGRICGWGQPGLLCGPRSGQQLWWNSRCSGRQP